MKPKMATTAAGTYSLSIAPAMYPCVTASLPASEWPICLDSCLSDTSCAGVPRCLRGLHRLHIDGSGVQHSATSDWSPNTLLSTSFKKRLKMLHLSVKMDQRDSLWLQPLPLTRRPHFSSLGWDVLSGPRGYKVPAGNRLFNYLNPFDQSFSSNYVSALKAPNMAINGLILLDSHTQQTSPLHRVKWGSIMSQLNAWAAYWIYGPTCTVNVHSVTVPGCRRG